MLPPQSSLPCAKGGVMRSMTEGLLQSKKDFKSVVQPLRRLRAGSPCTGEPKRREQAPALQVGASLRLPLAGEGLDVPLSFPSPPIQSINEYNIFFSSRRSRGGGNCGKVRFACQCAANTAIFILQNRVENRKRKCGVFLHKVFHTAFLSNFVENCGVFALICLPGCL